MITLRIHKNLIEPLKTRIGHEITVFYALKKLFLDGWHIFQPWKALKRLHGNWLYIAVMLCWQMRLMAFVGCLENSQEKHNA